MQLLVFLVAAKCPSKRYTRVLPRFGVLDPVPLSNFQHDRKGDEDDVDDYENSHRQESHVSDRSFFAL